MLRDNGRLTISRTTSTRSKDGWASITLVDKAAGIRVEVKADLRNFAKAILGEGHIPCDMVTFGPKQDT